MGSPPGADPEKPKTDRGEGNKDQTAQEDAQGAQKAPRRMAEPVGRPGQ